MTPETAAAAWQQMEAIRQQRRRDALGLDDIVQRLRDRAYSGKIPDALSEQAAREIERLRLTDAEREAIREAVRGYKFWAEDHVVYDRPEVQAVLYRLNGLLERLK